MKTFSTDFDNEILIGQNAHENDELFKRAHVGDVLFHLKGLPGAHVWFHGSPPQRGEVIQCSRLCKEHSKVCHRVTVEYLSKRHVSKDYSKPGSVIFRKRPSSIVI